MRGKNEHINFSAADFERYHAGKMPNEEMHALEKAALDDPFLSDALEGYAVTGTPIKDLEQITSRLSQTQHNKTIPIRSWQYSPLMKIAAVIIIIAAACIGYYFQQDNNKPEVAQVNTPSNKQKEQKFAEDNVPVMDNATVSATRNDSMQTKNLNQASAPGDISPDSRGKSVIKVIDLSKENRTEVPIVVADSTVSGNATFYTTSVNADSKVSKSLAGKVAGVQAKGPYSNLFTGKITDNNGRPVAFANLVDPQNNMHFRADSIGQFAIQTNDSNKQFTVNATGFQTEIYKLHLKDANNIVLLPTAIALNDEVLAEGNSVAKKDNASLKRSAAYDKKGSAIMERVKLSNVIPVPSWNAFNKYVADSLKTKEQLGEIATTADVSVSFDVDVSGKAYNIKVSKSLCAACDAETYRFIEQSSSWKLNSKQKKAKAIISF